MTPGGLVMLVGILLRNRRLAAKAIRPTMSTRIAVYGGQLNALSSPGMTDIQMTDAPAVATIRSAASGVAVAKGETPPRRRPSRPIAASTRPATPVTTPNPRSSPEYSEIAIRFPPHGVVGQWVQVPSERSNVNRPVTATTINAPPDPIFLASVMATG